MNNKFLAAMIMAVACAAGTTEAAKAPHIPGVVTESTMVISGYIQDLNSNQLIVSHTEFDDFTPIDASLTIDVIQDFQGKLTGTASFGSTHETGGAAFTVTGKAKMTNTGPGFMLKGTAPVTNASGKAKKAKLKVNATMIGFDAHDINSMSADLSSTATYQVAVNISGLGRNYSFTRDANLSGNFHFIYDLAPEEDVKYLKTKPNSDYYYLYAPWGMDLVDGTFNQIGADGYFTLKGPKFMFTGIDYDFDGLDFDPDYGSTKSGLGKYEGPFLKDDPKGTPAAVKSDTAPPSGLLRTLIFE